MTLRCWFGWHEWKMISHQTRVHKWADSEATFKYDTIFLFKCRHCTEMMTRIHEGSWSLKDEHDCDIKELRKMAGLE